ncbi:MFS transporter [Sphingomonas ginsenosidimutans]|uniref:MFS transporter n=1 Tax=Sphingomonas ginsenosidimutans TaxID=862134 RepID=A0A2A4I2L8_9SPHN|nr:MFS transporter [Sphingomonas ginsenosidimutans]PCG10175.1 MFS transporter [Sphingomonas ginsenosidimutans]
MATAIADRPSAPVGLIHLSLAVGGFAIGTTEFATMSLLPDMARDLGVDAPTAGHVISAYALGVVVGAPLLAVIGAKMARRTLLIALMAMFALGNALSAVAPDYGTMMAFRFLSGLPHGAYFGIATLVAASLVEQRRRTQAAARVLLGLTVATIVGVPLANALGQVVGWRSCFVIVAVLAGLTAALVALFAPRDRADADASPLRELAALRTPQVWLTLGVGAIGFGGLFAVYTYLADTMAAVTKVSTAVVPVALAVFGVGMTAGNLIVPRFADRALLPTAAGVLVWSAASLMLWPFAAGHLWSVIVAVLLIGVGGSLGSVLQTRLMDVAGDAQGLAAALNHSAFNVANALGPWLGGMAIAAGYGWTSTGWVGAALALGGLAMLAVSWAVERRAT